MREVVQKGRQKGGGDWKYLHSALLVLQRLSFLPYCFCCPPHSSISPSLIWSLMTLVFGIFLSDLLLWKPGLPMSWISFPALGSKKTPHFPFLVLHLCSLTLNPKVFSYPLWFHPLLLLLCAKKSWFIPIDWRLWSCSSPAYCFEYKYNISSPPSLLTSHKLLHLTLPMAGWLELGDL